MSTANGASRYKFKKRADHTEVAEISTPAGNVVVVVRQALPDEEQKLRDAHSTFVHTAAGRVSRLKNDGKDFYQAWADAFIVSAEGGPVELLDYLGVPPENEADIPKKDDGTIAWDADLIREVFWYGYADKFSDLVFRAARNITIKQRAQAEAHLGNSESSPAA